MYFSDKTIVYHDGAWLKATDASVDLYGQTLHYGIGVFEGIRAYRTKTGPVIFKAKEHYDRLLMSAEKMHIALDYDANRLTSITYQLLDANGFGDAYIRPLVYLDPNMSLTTGTKPHLLISAWKWGKLLGDKQLSVRTSSYCRPHPKSCHVEAKVSGHYVNSVLASAEARKHGFDEALLLDHNGFVAEGPGANFFYEENGELFTAPLGNILPGITRATVMELCQELRVRVHEKLFELKEVYNSDSAFFTGTAAEIVGIASVDNRALKMPWDHSLGAQLAAMYRRRVREIEYARNVLI